MKIKCLVAVALLVQLAASPIHAQELTAPTESVIESAGSSTRIVKESAPFQASGTRNQGPDTNQGSGTVQELPPLQGPALPLLPTTQEPSGSATVQELPPLAPIAPLPVEPTLEFQGSGMNQQIIDLPIEAAPQLSPADNQLFDSLAPAQPAPAITPGVVVLDQQDQLDPQLRLKPSDAAPRPNLGVFGQPIRGWGFAVQSVVPNSVAARMRLEPGDVILAVNGQPAGSAATITEQLLISTQQNNGCGTVLIDNVRARNQRPVRTCNGYSRTNNRLRYQKIRFQL